MRAKEKFIFPARSKRHTRIFPLSFLSRLSEDDTRGAPPSKDELGSIFTSAHMLFWEVKLEHNRPFNYRKCICSKWLSRAPRSCEVLIVTAFRKKKKIYRKEGGWRETVLSYTLQHMLHVIELKSSCCYLYISKWQSHISWDHKQILEITVGCVLLHLYHADFCSKQTVSAGRSSHLASCWDANTSALLHLCFASVLTSETPAGARIRPFFGTCWMAVDAW